VGHVACMGRRDVYRVLVGRPKRRQRCRLEDNIKMDLRKMEIDGVNWIQLAQDSPMASFLNIVMNLRVP